MFDDFLQFSRMQPFACAVRTNFNLRTVVFNRVKDCAASWAFHRFSANYAGDGDGGKPEVKATKSQSRGSPLGGSEGGSDGRVNLTSGRQQEKGRWR
jgi:hypothetical protein